MTAPFTRDPERKSPDGAPLPVEVYADPGRYDWYFRERKPDSVARFVRDDICIPRAEHEAAVAAVVEAAASMQFGWYIGIDRGTGEPDGTYCSVKTDDCPDLYINAESIRALTPAYARASLDRMLAEARAEAVENVARRFEAMGGFDGKALAHFVLAAADALSPKPVDDRIGPDAGGKGE